MFSVLLFMMLGIVSCQVVALLSFGILICQVVESVWYVFFSNLGCIVTMFFLFCFKSRVNAVFGCDSVHFGVILVVVNASQCKI